MGKTQAQQLERCPSEGKYEMLLLLQRRMVSRISRQWEENRDSTLYRTQKSGSGKHTGEGRKSKTSLSLFSLLDRHYVVITCTKRMLYVHIVTYFILFSAR
jgi:hypothetical protein